MTVWRKQASFREVGLLSAIVLVLCVGSLAAFFLLPGLLVGWSDLTAHPPAATRHAANTTAARTQPPTGVDLAAARSNVRTGLVALFAALGAGIATAFAGRTYYLTRQTNRISRFTTAVELLGSAKPSLQVGALYELEQIAHSSPVAHCQVLAVVQEYLRRGSDQEPRRTFLSAPRTGAQAACDLLRRRRHDWDPERHIDLSYTDLGALDLSGINLSDSSLSGASLDGTDFSDAILCRANLMNATARGALFLRANLRNATLEGADLTSAGFTDADFAGATLARATFDPQALQGARGWED